MNAIQFLKQEHEKARAEFSRMLQASATMRGAIWEELQPELVLHEQIEGACVYEPLSRDAAGADPTLAQWRDSHQQEVRKVERLMEEIKALDATSSEWLTKVREVHTSLQTHIQEEEGTIFPRIPRVWDAARLDRAGQELEEMKSRNAAAGRR
ncbi:MAG TPA: hemerythrin domain-containing protein [Methylomirabilota bacterium]|nr:hemerythrin domain-containing protein [Methylomirabilota bacterium]